MLASRRSTITVGLALTLPLAYWLIWLGLDSWTPQGDLGIQTVKVHDVFSSNLQLLGMPATSYHEVEGLYANHPGSIYFQLIAVGYSVSGHQPFGLLLGGAVVAAALIFGSLRAGFVVAGRNGLLVVALTFGVIELYLAGRMLTGWNPNVTAISLTAAVFFGWAVLEGRRWFAIGFVIATALAAQSHVAGVPIALAVFLFVAGVAARRTWRGAKKGSGFWVALFVVIALSWWAPVTDAIVRDPGNLQSLSRWIFAGGGESVSGQLRLASLGIGLVALSLAAIAWRRRSQTAWGSLFAVGAVAIVAVGAVAVLVPARIGYLGFVSGPVLVVTLAMARRWLPSGRSRSFGRLAVFAFAVLVLLLPVLPQGELASSRIAAQVTTAATKLMLRNLDSRDLPVVVDGTGAIAWASMASAVQAALVADVGEATLRNEVVDADQVWRRAALTGPRRELFVREIGANSQAWEPPTEARVIDSAKVVPEESLFVQIGSIRDPATEGFELVLLEFR